MTIFLGCGFAAKYREGGGVFSVPLQWIFGLKRLQLDAIWLEILPGSGNEPVDRAAIKNFAAQLRFYGLAENYCLLYQPRAGDAQDLDKMRCFGLPGSDLRERLAGPNTLLNLSYSVHPPLLLQFERRIFCDLDPSEIFYWMTKMEMGQSYHHEFWTIGLNAGRSDCSLPRSQIRWQTFFPLVDTEFVQPQRQPTHFKFTTIGQWYWGGAVEVNGEFPDLSKKVAFEKYLDLPARTKKTRFELAMNLGRDDPERARLSERGWHVVDPHRVAKTSARYRHYLASAAAEFTAIKGVDVAWQTGWMSDRAAMFLAMGRPVVTENTGAAKYLPKESGFRFVNDLESAIAAVNQVIADWSALSTQSRAVAIELFDSERNLRKILDLPRPQA
ncbi:MAG: hypothetical protein DME42_12735 [Verrucomicrobia bacterium]|nr:MAG: hypothetical protein DME42_12735 [Verrucomicrobiota bacterium]